MYIYFKNSITIIIDLVFFFKSNQAFSYAKHDALINRYNYNSPNSEH